MAAPIAVALDAPDVETASRWAAAVAHVSTLKVGLELYLRYGPAVVEAVRGARETALFLDLKLHDIPATVAGAARSVAGLAPASSPCMRPEARHGPRRGGGGTRDADRSRDRVTSLEEVALGRWGCAARRGRAVPRLAVLAGEARARLGVSRRKRMVRAEVSPDAALGTPGVRPAGAARGARRGWRLPRGGGGRGDCWSWDRHYPRTGSGGGG